MLKNIKYILVFLCTYLVFLAAFFPASFAVNYAKSERLLPKEIALKGVSGSIWNGHLAFVEHPEVTLDNVSWKLSALPLLWGQADIAFKAGKRRSDIIVSGDASLTANSVSLSDVTLKTTIETLLRNRQLPLGLEANGKVRVTVDEYVQGKPYCKTLKAKIATTDSQIKSPFGQMPVERIAAVLTCPNGELVATIKPKDNSLGINGSIALNKSNKYKLQATVLPPANAPQDLTNVLNFVGSPNSQGQYSFKHNGRL